jgi:hypothetical protein
MLPDFLVRETTVRDAGESNIFDSGAPIANDQTLVLTLGITHAVEQESIQVEIYGSSDGLSWSPRPVASFPEKSYCGSYHLTLHAPCPRFLKAAWRVRRWSRADSRPYFSFYIFGQTQRVRAMAGAA